MSELTLPLGSLDGDVPVNVQALPKDESWTPKLSKYGNPLGRPKGSKNRFPHKDSIGWLDQQAAEGRAKLAAARAASMDINELSMLARDVSRSGSAESLLRYYQDAQELGPRGIILECLVIARFLLGQEARKKPSERDTRLVLSCTSAVSQLTKQLVELEEHERKIAAIVKERLDVAYRQIATILTHELSSQPVLYQRVVQRLAGQIGRDETVHVAQIVG